MKLLEARNQYGLSAGWEYSSGALHGSWDIKTPQGTPLHSDVGGLVRDIADGVQNNRPGQNPGSGSPSNYVLLHTPYSGGTATIYINHLSPGIKVRKGDRIQPGTLLGYSGNSGNSTGPHTHVTTMKGEYSAPDRYIYLNRPEIIIWEPSKVLAAGGGSGSGDDWRLGAGHPVYAKYLKFDGHEQNADRHSLSIEALQEMLRRHGHSDLPITGKYWTQTDAAVRACQAAHIPPADAERASYVGPKQWTHLAEATGCPYKYVG